MEARMEPEPQKPFASVSQSAAAKERSMEKRFLRGFGSGGSAMFETVRSRVVYDQQTDDAILGNHRGLRPRSTLARRAPIVLTICPSRYASAHRSSRGTSCPLS